MFRIGRERGYLTDYVTQLWVRSTGRSVDFATAGWLAGPIGKPDGIGATFFQDYADEIDAKLEPGEGLLQDFGCLSGTACDPGRVQPAVIDFYEKTARYELEAWSEWCGFFRPFGAALAALFSRRLQQLNVPLSNLDSSGGIESRVWRVLDPSSGDILACAWVRTYKESKRVLYAGSYSHCTVPGYKGGCVKVVFPLPNGNAVVIMYPQVHSDGSLTLSSIGERFGDPGFYFTVQWRDRMWARYVRSMRETIHVYADGDSGARADHVLKIWGQVFLRIHYRMRPVFAISTSHE
jgi:hypothetical protein